MERKNDLIKLTNTFLDMHWPDHLKRPEWSPPWDFVSGIPNGNQPGCYAFIDKDGEIVYIGVGASKGGGMYKGFGLAHRINKYKRKVYGEKVNYKLTDYWMKKAKTLITIGLPDDLFYLSYALEGFLIKELEPKENVVGKR